MDEVEQFLSEVAMSLAQKLEESAQRVRRIVKNLEIDEDEYKHLVIREVIHEIIIDAQFAFPPHTLHTPSEVKERAVKLLNTFLERDERLFTR